MASQREFSHRSWVFFAPCSEMWVRQLSHFCHHQWCEEPCSSSCMSRFTDSAVIPAVANRSKNTGSLISFALQTPLLTVPDGSGAQQGRERDPENQVLLLPLPVLRQVAAGLSATGGRPGGDKLSAAQLSLPELQRCPQPAGEPRLLCTHQPQPVQHGSR